MVQSGADVAGFARQRPKLDGSRAALTTPVLSLIAPLRKPTRYLLLLALADSFSSPASRRPNGKMIERSGGVLPTQLRDWSKLANSNRRTSPGSGKRTVARAKIGGSEYKHSIPVH